jgi:protocatechuate 3,4-dioxygenase beta subunit
MTHKFGVDVSVKLRDDLRRRVLSGLVGRIDNQRYFREGDDGDPHRPTKASSPGPYYIADPPLRRDVREDREGLPLLLRVTTVDADTLQPLPGVSVEIWHSDALGAYSGYQAYHPDRFPNVPLMLLRRYRPTDATRFLRGRQVADDRGVVEFQTIVPGWYTPRTLHIHYRAFLDGVDLMTAEFYFTDEFAARVQGLPPYDQRGPSPFGNDHDIEIRMAKGSAGSWLDVTETADGAVGTITVKVKRTEESK